MPYDLCENGESNEKKRVRENICELLVSRKRVIERHSTYKE